MICDIINSYYRNNDYDSGACQGTGNYDTAGGRMVNRGSSYSGRSRLYRNAPMNPFLVLRPSSSKCMQEFVLREAAAKN